MEDYLANEMAFYSELTNQILLPAIEYLLLLVAGVIALVTASALLAVVVVLIWRSWRSVVPPSLPTAQFPPTSRRFAIKRSVHTTLLFCGALCAAALSAGAQTGGARHRSRRVCRIAEFRTGSSQGQ